MDEAVQVSEGFRTLAASGFQRSSGNSPATCSRLVRNSMAKKNDPHLYREGHTAGPVKVCPPSLAISALKIQLTVEWPAHV